VRAVDRAAAQLALSKLKRCSVRPASAP
jgi:hypothetical protein